MNSGHTQYDNPEPGNDKRGKALAFAIGGIVVVTILCLLATGRVEILN